MGNRNFFFIMLALLLASTAGAQNSGDRVTLFGCSYDLNHFEGLRSEGEMPADLRMDLMELYQHDKQQVKEYTNSVLYNRDKVLESSYYISRMLASGCIVFGDPISQLASRIADTLLSDYPSLRSELRFYTVKSPEVNAFATGQGMIFICTGLISHLHNEAELAYVISHEIVHYMNKHSLEVLTRGRNYSKDIDAETKELRDFIKYHNRSREMETEADQLGLERFYMPGPYSRDAVGSLLTVLQYSLLPYSEVELDTTLFNTPYLKLPGRYFMESTDDIVVRDDENDSLSTHPNIRKRRLLSEGIIGQDQGGEDFVMISKEDFAKLQQLSRQEDIRQMLIYGDFVQAFYHSYLLRQAAPDNEYAEQAFCASLYALSKYKSYANTRILIDSYMNRQGAIQQCYHLFGAISSKYMAVITAHQLYESMRRFPDNRQLAAMCDDIFPDLATRFKYKPADFERLYRADSPSPSAAADNSHASRIERLRAQQASGQRMGDTDPLRFAFTDLFGRDSLFAPYLEWRLQAAAPSAPTADVQSLKGSRQLVYSPQYFVYDEHVGRINVRKSYKNEGLLFNDVCATARRKGISSVDFSDRHLHTVESADEYNEWTTVTEWLIEVDRYGGQFNKVASTQGLMTPIAQRYGATSVNASEVFNYEQVHTARPSFWYVLSTVLLPLELPIVINDMAQGAENTTIHSTQYDALTGRMLKTATHQLDVADGRAVVRGNLYDMYHNMGRLSSRPSGYMGSRLIVSGSVSLGPRLQLLHSTSYIDRRFPKSSFVGLQYGAEVEYLSGRTSSLACSFVFEPTGVEDYSQGWLEYNRLQVGLEYRNYMAGNLAPMGPYLGFGAVYAELKPVGTSNVIKRGVGWQFDMGRHYILANHLVLGLTSQYALVFPFGMGNLEEPDDLNLAIFTGGFMKMGISLGFMP